jgi:hypothetical protein
MARADNNNAVYGPCVATTYKRLELSGLPTTDSPGFAGVVMELVVLKQDAYNQTVTADSSSSLQVFSANDGTRGANDRSVSFLGAIITVFKEGRARFSIAVKPTFAKVSMLVDRTALLRQQFLYMSGTDLATGGAMETDVHQVHLATHNRSACRLGTVLVLDDSNTMPTPGACVQCSPKEYNVKALTGVCLACPPSAECFNGAPPLFGASKVKGAIELELADGVGDDAKKSAIAAKVGVEFWQIQLVLPSQGQQRRSTRSIQFELVADKTLMAALVQRVAAIGVVLDAIQDIGNLAEGEVWVQDAGRYLLKSCAPGSQLINTTDNGEFNVDAQKCRPCGVTTYIIDQMHGCKKCPKGAGNPSNCQLCPCILFLENPAARECVCICRCGCVSLLSSFSIITLCYRRLPRWCQVSWQSQWQPVGG